MTVIFSKTARDSAMRAVAGVIGDSGRCFLFQGLHKVTGEGTWKFVDGVGFEFEVLASRATRHGNVLLLGATDDAFVRVDVVGTIGKGKTYRNVASIETT